jgi:hypothetical protein
MSKVSSCFFVAVAAIFASLSAVAQAEEGTVRAMAPWQGEGQLYQVGPEQVVFVGAFSGIMYVQKGEDALDALLMLCPAAQELDLQDGVTESKGFCTFQNASGDKVFAKWECKGKVGACAGEMVLTGGTGEYSGIHGGGAMTARSVLSELAANLDSGSVVRSAAGLIVWPELKYVIP